MSDACCSTLASASNVEYVVAERIGEETVTYVSNIFKYYLAYQLVAAAEQERAAARQTMDAGSQ